MADAVAGLRAKYNWLIETRGMTHQEAISLLAAIPSRTSTWRKFLASLKS